MLIFVDKVVLEYQKDQHPIINSLEAVFAGFESCQFTEQSLPDFTRDFKSRFGPPRSWTENFEAIFVTQKQRLCQKRFIVILQQETSGLIIF